MVETAVVGRTVDNTLIITDIQEEGGGAAAVEVEGVVAAEPAEDLLQFRQGKSGCVLETSVGHYEQDSAVIADAYGRTVVAVGDEGAVVAHVL